MTNAEFVTISKSEYEDLLRRCEDLEDRLIALSADPNADSETRIPHEVVLDMFAGSTPVAAFRRYHGLTVRQLADKCGFSPSYLSEIERGRKLGSTRVLSRLADTLDTTINALIP